MSVREIGPYVLLHQLAEDTLSETYRAGLKSGDDVERVVLLCLFKGSAEDTAWISETASMGRNALKGLESSHLAELVDAGEVEGRAYLAYEYLSGISLSRVMSESRREKMPVPLELALFIADRTSKALLDAWQHESRMLHGFLVPPLVLITSEGEPRLLGFEVASRLRRLLNDQRLGAELGNYLAPEVVPQGQPATTDDVYSLGAMIFGLITGETPPRESGALEQAIAGATLADGGEMPEEVRQLLASCLAPPPRRSNLQSCTERLTELVLSGRYDATSFNLALFLHRLFGEELEEESEVRVDRGPSPKARASAAASLHEEAEEPTPQPVADLAPAPEADDVFDLSSEELDDGAHAPEPHGEQETPQEAGVQRAHLGIAASIAAIALVGVGALYFGDPFGSGEPQSAGLTALEVPTPGFRPRSQPESALEVDTEAAAGETPRQPEPPTAGAAGNAATPPSAEDMERRVEELAKKRSQSLEADMRRGYEQQINQLKAQLEALKTAPADSRATDAGPAPIEQPAVQELAVQDLAVEDLPVEEVAPQRIASLEGTTPPGSDAAAQSPSSATMETTTAAGGETGAEPAERPSEPLGRQATPEDRATPPGTTEAAPAEPRVPAVQVGDLVKAGPGVTLPKLTRPVQPSYPLLARRLNKQAVVAVRVLVDENGRVERVEQLGEAAGYGFDESAIEAARQMEWEPAMKEGVRVKMWFTVRLAFKP